MNTLDQREAAANSKARKATKSLRAEVNSAHKALVTAKDNFRRLEVEYMKAWDKAASDAIKEMDKHEQQ